MDRNYEWLTRQLSRNIEEYQLRILHKTKEMPKFEKQHRLVR